MQLQVHRFNIPVCSVVLASHTLNQDTWLVWWHFFSSYWKTVVCYNVLLYFFVVLALVSIISWNTVLTKVIAEVKKNINQMI